MCAPFTHKRKSTMSTLYTAHAHVTGGRDGAAKTDDGKLDVKLAPPKELGGNGAGTNPEQLFAAGYRRDASRRRQRQNRVAASHRH